MLKLWETIIHALRFLCCAILVWKERSIYGMEGVPIMDKVKECLFKRLLEAGAASVGMEAELNLYSHAFVDTTHLKSSRNVRIQTHNRNIIETRKCCSHNKYSC